jgi:hypothetical protein
MNAEPTEMKVAAVKEDPHEKTILDDPVRNSAVHPSVLAQPMIDDRLPEGRVHGGGLLALLSQRGSSTSAGGSENCASGKMAWM